MPLIAMDILEEKVKELLLAVNHLNAENAALKAKQNASAQLLEDVAGRLKALEARAGLNGSK